MDKRKNTSSSKGRPKKSTSLAVPIVQVEQNDIEDSYSFRVWLNNSTGKFYKRIAIYFSILYSIISILRANVIDILNMADYLGDIPWIRVSYIIHTLFILIVLATAAFRFKAFSYPDEEFPSEKKVAEHLTIKKSWINFKQSTNLVVEQFSRSWLACWVAWFFLYLVFTINSFSPDEHKPYCSQIVINTINNFSSIMFIFMFMTLTVKTSKKNGIQWFLIIFFLLCPLILAEYFTPVENKNITIWYTIFSGLFGSFSMAAFFGSLNSRVIAIPIGMFMMLYLYSAIQPFYILLDEHFITVASVQTIVIIVNICAFLLKVILFLITTWLLRTGRLTHLVMQEKSLYNEGETYFKTLLSNCSLKNYNITDHRKNINE
jgi:hypothetical protein